MDAWYRYMDALYRHMDLYRTFFVQLTLMDLVKGLTYLEFT